MMSEYDLPVAVEIDGQQFKIRENCDYRIILRCINALNDGDLTDDQKIQCAIIIFYEDYNLITNPQKAAEEMFRIIGYNEPQEAGTQKPPLMDWNKDFQQLAPPISRIIGYDIRTPGKYTHWWTLVGGYMEIGECTFATIVSIRSKKQKGKKLEKWEQEYYRDNRQKVELQTPDPKEKAAMQEYFNKWL